LVVQVIDILDTRRQPCECASGRISAFRAPRSGLQRAQVGLLIGRQRITLGLPQGLGEALHGLMLGGMALAVSALQGSQRLAHSW